MDAKELNNQIDEALETIPEELYSFLFGGEFDVFFDSYKPKFQNEDVLTDIRNKTLQFILGITPLVEVKTTIEQNISTKELAAELKLGIQQHIIDEILTILEVHRDMENTPSPIKDKVSNVIKHLTDPLITPTTTAPIKREYGDSAPAAAKPVVDPYREIPEK